MDSKKLDDLILQIDNFLECWKQYNNYLSLARSKKFSAEDESQFLELKSVITQELEMILASVEPASPTKDDVINVVSAAPSLRFLSELNDGAVRALENQWHKIYIGWQSILGQLKVQQRTADPPSRWGKLFGRKPS